MTYKIYTLGCKVNEYESEVMAFMLNKAGYKESDYPDICIVNTCTVTNMADSKSRKLIRSLKKKFPRALIVAVGCMIQNKKDVKELDIDIALGNKDKSKIVEYIKNYKEKLVKLYDVDDMDFEDMQLSKFNLTRAYIKIQDGCDNYCSFCIIPYVRGHVRCKSKDVVLAEANSLVQNGHKEIVLTGIHTGNYHDDEYDFVDLLSDLIKIKGLLRLRISSIEITELNDKFLNVLKRSNILTNHMHIPLQSGSNEILKKMNRKYNKEYFINMISEIRKIRPDINITTDVIVGFPYESDEFFNETIETIEKIKFTKLHVFPYSKREGTMASKMPQVDGKIKKKRVKKLLDLSKKLELDYMTKYIGLNISFIPEVYVDGFLIGHTDNYLLVKALGNESELYKEVLVTLEKCEYPYMIGNFDKTVDKS